LVKFSRTSPAGTKESSPTSMTTNKLKILPSHKVVTLDNCTCVYCGEELTPEETTKEHVIGRRFVPKGKLNCGWNLLVNACRGCNNVKSDLENDISAITMQPDAWGRHPNDDQALSNEARRKGQNSISRRTKKPVKDSREEIKIEVPFGSNATFSFTTTCPPMIERQRLYELARLQLMGFFYLTTYSEKTKRGGFWLGAFCPVQEALISDWGNPVHLSFMDTVATWKPIFLGIGADGYYKVVIRRHPSAICWAWGLEWNQNFRIVGFMGEPEALDEVLRAIPSIDMMTIPEGPDRLTRFRAEKRLAEEEDILFNVEQFEQYGEIPGT